MVLMGETFIEADEDYAEDCKLLKLSFVIHWFDLTIDCEKKVRILEKKIAKLTTEEGDIVRRQEDLKKILYGKFGDSINLEN